MEKEVGLCSEGRDLSVLRLQMKPEGCRISMVRKCAERELEQYASRIPFHPLFWMFVKNMVLWGRLFTIKQF